MAQDADDSLSIYLRQVARTPLLTAAQERSLGATLEQGWAATRQLGQEPPLSPGQRQELEARVADARAAEREFVRSNLRLVISIARRYQHMGLPLPDLIQEGNLGLMRAVERFDHRRGMRFSTYATWVIRQAITRAIENTGRVIRIPVRALEAIRQLRRAEIWLQEEHGRCPSSAELGAVVGMSAEQVRDLLSHSVDATSLSCDPGPADDDIDHVIGDQTFASPLDRAMSVLLTEETLRFMEVLDAQERTIVHLRFGLGGGRPVTIQAASETLGLSPLAVRRIQRQALDKLRRFSP
ncbi:MAG: sigma-70 family RNA polymerase sigma factor, partial [Acidimicrobiales bacterium]